ncbi:MAG TPA: isoprenylcysteine carboxylmethyltransferase family protein [Bdellovibrionota bacterium]|nr:isoprenylcysteine carboxylmethyltransferase family protein [Bdellovibrionota bacterium]
MPREKLVRGLLVPVLFSLAPAAFRTGLLWRIEPWLCYLTGAVLVLSQPAIPFNPGAREYRDPADRYSALAIHAMVFLAAGAAAVHFVLYPLEMSSEVRYAAIVAGFLLAVAGLTVRIWSIRTLGRCFTPTVRIHPDHELIQSGPYRWIRHPSYLGATAAVCAPAVIYGAWLLVPVTLIALLVAYSYRIRIEDRALHERFGHDFERYARQAGALCPRIFRP